MAGMYMPGIEFDIPIAVSVAVKIYAKINRKWPPDNILEAIGISE